MMAKDSSDTEMGVKDHDGSLSNSNIGSNFYIEEASAVTQNDHPKTAHRIDHDPWYQLGLLLAVSFNCGYILGFSNFIMKPLGWVWGSIFMAVLAVISVYASWLTATLHIIDGRRFIRYRDLMGYAFGMKMYYLTWTLQFLLFILGNMGFLVLSGRALKEIYLEYDKSSKMTLQEFIIISGGVYFVFSFLVPHLSAMKMWCRISTFLTFIYIVILMKISISDGMSNSKDYKVHGTRIQKIFNGFNAITTIIFASNSGMIPELQVFYIRKDGSTLLKEEGPPLNQLAAKIRHATLRQPVIKNMHKALYFQFTIGLGVYYTVTIIGYWAYGTLVSDYLLNELSGPKWAKILANVAVYLQIIVSQHMFFSPVHETLDTRFSHINEKEFSLHNMSTRFILRFMLFTINTFVAAMFPFLGDFVSLMGAVAVIPLTFIFPSLICLKVKGQTMSFLEKIWHWLNVITFSLLSIITTISSFHSIVDNSRTYHFFANT